MEMENSLNLTIGKFLPMLQKRILERSTYHGVRTLKNPFDFWIYMEIISSMKPDFIVEIGNNWGGSTLALAHQLDLINNGQVIGIDISHAKIPDKVRSHPRIKLIESPALDAFESVDRLIGKNKRVLVIEDSSHTFEHTLEVLRLYKNLTRIGDYFIVEDTICHHGLDVGPKPGPYEAVQKFLDENSDFIVDREIESFLITHNPMGYLKRIS